MGNVFTRIISKMKLAKGIDRMNGHRLYLGLPLYELGFDAINTEEANDMFYDGRPEDIDEPFDADEGFDSEGNEDTEDFDDGFDTEEDDFDTEEDDFDSDDIEDEDSDDIEDEDSNSYDSGEFDDIDEPYGGN